MPLVIDPTRLRGARLSQALTHRELSALAGVSPRTIERLEGGLYAGRVSTIGRIARGLGVQPLDIAEIVER